MLIKSSICWWLMIFAAIETIVCSILARVIHPNCHGFDLLSDEEKKMNASYIISIARKLGCSKFCFLKTSLRYGYVCYFLPYSNRDIIAVACFNFQHKKLQYLKTTPSSCSTLSRVQLKKLVQTTKKKSNQCSDILVFQ